MSYRYVDNSKKVLEEFDNALDRALIRMGMSAEGYAKKALTSQHAVDTGLLRNSITFAISGGEANISDYKANRGDGSGSYSGSAPSEKEKAVYIGTNVEYAAYVELGTTRTKAKPYLKPAVTEHSTVYKRIMEEEMGKEMGK